jgi:hypothetical protein
MGGPTGWVVGAFQKQKQDNQNQQNQQGQQQATPTISRISQVADSTRSRRMLVQQSMMAKARGISIQRLLIPTARDATTSGTSSTSGSSDQSDQQQNNDKTNFNFDKNGLATVQSKDTDHNITVDSKGKKITLNIPVGEWGYAGGDGSKGKYSRIMTEDGPSVNFKARIG